MKIIGIVPPSRLRETENPYEDNAIFHELYTKRVEEADGIPIGIIGVNGKVKEEALALCDAFLLCGGKRIFPYHFQVIDYALKTGKKLLGVCLGMQAIHSYFIAKEEQRNRPGKSILEVYEEMKKERYFFVEPVEGHWKCNPNWGEEHLVKQEIRIIEDSALRKHFPGDRIQGASMHRYRITKPAEDIRAVAFAEDGGIEGIEYGEKMLGIQFHPEIDQSFPGIFRFLTN